jgi:choline kinase
MDCWRSTPSSFAQLKGFVMKVVILAAGAGRRLGLDMSKVLVELGDNVKMIDNHLSAIEPHIPRDDIVVVTGFQSEIVEAAATGCHFVYNPHFQSTNTAKSLMIGLTACAGHDVILINGDLFYPTETFRRVLSARGNLIGVRYGSLSDEEVKFVTNRSGHVVGLSKQVVGGEGEAVGINRFDANTISALMSSLHQTDPMDYFEAGIEKILDTAPFRIVDLTDTGCIEIDFPSDLQIARDRFASMRRAIAV